jgi:hypothetical protein
MQAVTTIGLDIAKSVFQIHGVDAAGNARQNETTTVGFNGVFEVPPPGAFASHFGLDGEAHLRRRFRARRLCASDARGNGQCDGVRS